MYVKDYMSTDLVTIVPGTTIIKALDLMREYDIRRLPVVKNGKMLGLLTDIQIAKNSPSQATSLSVHELNYLLNKTEAKDIMLKKFRTIRPEALLEEAASIMRTEDIGSLVVMENNTLVGIITDKDIFDAFINVSGYNYPGVRLGLEIPHDRKGILVEIGSLFVDADINISQISVFRLKDDAVQIVLHVETDDEIVARQLLENAGYELVSVTKKPA